MISPIRQLEPLAEYCGARLDFYWVFVVPLFRVVSEDTFSIQALFGEQFNSTNSITVLENSQHTVIVNNF